MAFEHQCRRDELLRRPVYAALASILCSLINGCGGSGSVALTAVPTAHLAIALSSTTTMASAPYTFTVSALDANNAAVPSYVGTVRVSTSDTSATLPANTTLSRGSGTFTVTFNGVGSQTITANDTLGNAISGSSAPITVSAIPTPSLTSLSSNTVSVGATVVALTVNGSNFVPSSIVRWNGTNLSTTYVSASQLSALVSAQQVGATVGGTITVFNPAPGGGSSNPLVFNGPVPAVSPVPDITALGPDCTPVGLPFAFTRHNWQPNQLSVQGHNFAGNSIVEWNGNSRPTTFLSNEQLQVDLSAADIAAAGKDSVTVYNPAPGGGTSNTLTFTVTTGGLSPTSIAVDPSGKFVSVATQGCSSSLISYVSRYAVDSTSGLLTPVGSPQLAYDEGARFVAASPVGQFVFLASWGYGDAGSVASYAIDPTTGGLTFVDSWAAPCLPYPGSCSPWSLAVDSGGKFVYVANEGGFVPTSVTVYAINSATGVLSLLQTVAAPAGRASTVTLDPSGKYAYVATTDDSGGAGSVSTYGLDVTSGSMTYIGTIAAGVNPVATVVDRGGGFAYAVNSGSNNISLYTISAGKLTLTGTVGSGQKPVSMSVDPATKFAYVVNSASNDVSMYKIDATTGALTSIGTIAAGVSPASIAIDPTGTFAYVANSGTNNISIYAINSATGALTLVGTSGT